MEQATDEICDKCGAPLILKWGKFGSFYSCANFTKEKPMTVAAGPWKKDPKAVTEEDHEGAALSDDREGDDGGCDRVLEGGRRTRRS